MKRAILLYSLMIAAVAWLLQWLEYRYSVRAFSTEIYIVLVALGFTALGVWVGHRLTLGRSESSFEKNTRVIETLGISEREFEVLELLAEGHSNKEIAERLFVSPHTVKTHLAHLYDKLEVSRRTEAVRKARRLRMIP
jgi:DNA-binding CsgD family transcriptional regulator